MQTNNSQSLQKKQKSNKMDFIEKITLSPFEKYIRFNRFPWKFIFHLLLLVLTTYQAMKIVSIQDKHTRIQQEIFSTIYLQNDDGSSSYPYYSLSDFTDKFFGVVEQTENLNQVLLQYSDISDVWYRLVIYYSQITEDNQQFMIIEGDQETYLLELQKIPLTPDNYTQMKTFIQKIQKMNLEIQNITTYISMDDSNKLNSCLNWTINIGYSFESFANVDSMLDANSFPCLIDDKRVDNEQSLIFLHFTIIIISSLSLFFLWRQVYQISKEYMFYKRSAKKSEISRSRFKSNVHWDKDWSELGFFDKLKFFDFWFIIMVTGNFFQLFGAVVALLDHFITTKLVIFEHKQILIGFGVMLAWITILKYLEYSNNLNLMTSTLSKSWGNLLMFLLGVMPFFLGFVFLGQTIFWKYNKFQDTSSSIVTLFSLLNGDIVNDTFLQTWAQGLPGQLYLIIFMVLFYTAVQNVFVTIIMQGYEESIKQREHKKMLEEKQEKDQAEFQQNLLNLQQMQRININMSSPQLSPQQNAGLSKIRINGKKVDKILDEVQRIIVEIEESQLSASQKKYLGQIIKDNLQSISRTIKIQIKEIRA